MNESTYISQCAAFNGNRLVLYTNPLFASNPTLVFLHDSLGSIELWRDFPIKLGQATSCNVSIFERSGHGKSAPFDSSVRPVDYLAREADRLAELIINFEISNPILFGHSDGGSIALITAAKFPTLVRAVIAEAAHIFVEEITLNGIRNAVIQYENGDLKSKLRKYHGENTELLFWLWASTWLSPEYRNWQIEHFLHDIQCPVLILQGENDEYGSLGQVEGIGSQISGESYQFIFRNVGHTPHKEAPIETLQKAVDFILKML